MTRLESALAARFSDADEIKDVANYGCVAGVSGFIYHKEIREFFNEYEEEIEATLVNLCMHIKDLVNYDTTTVNDLITQMVWIVVENYCQSKVLEAEAEHHYAVA